MPLIELSRCCKWFLSDIARSALLAEVERQAKTPSSLLLLIPLSSAIFNTMVVQALCLAAALTQSRGRVNKSLTSVMHRLARSPICLEIPQP